MLQPFSIAVRQDLCDGIPSAAAATAGSAFREVQYLFDRIRPEAREVQVEAEDNIRQITITTTALTRAALLCTMRI